ncbi:MAG: imidazole glycerol phosphate synthase subunit HisH [Eubacteriales bacterium]|nr:imidazole glycerol phosphate synthase subunit HisH [Eubacteriales bacterium]
MVAIIDYDAGNIRSVENAMTMLGKETVLTRDPGVIRRADHVILPGVGSFGDAMDRIRRYGLEEVIREVVQSDTPFLGICLGLQLLFEESEESPGVKGLSVLRGKIRRIPAGTEPETGTLRKIPQIGWNNLAFPRQGRLFRDIEEGAYVYFVHSYYLQAESKEIVTATTQYGVTVEASVERNNVFACQFHPEKSAEVGLQILTNFLQV